MVGSLFTIDLSLPSVCIHPMYRSKYANDPTLKYIIITPFNQYATHELMNHVSFPFVLVYARVRWILATGLAAMIDSTKRKVRVGVGIILQSIIASSILY